MAQQTKIHATGKRKTSVARVFLTPGNGRIAVNGREFEEYFPVLALRAIAVQPLVLTGRRQSVDVEVNVRGGGPAAGLGLLRQIGAETGRQAEREEDGN